LSKLTRNPSAILLQNALLDTSLPISLSIPDSLKAQSGSGSYIVQARGPPDAAFRALVTRAGGSIVSYIPNNAFLVRASENSALGLRSSALVQSVLPYEPYYKLSPSLLDLAVSNPAQTEPSGLFLNLLLFPDASDRSAIAALAQISSEEPSPFGPILHIQASAGSLSALARLSGVQAIEPAARRLPANDLSRARLGVATSPTTAVNYLGLSGANVLVNVNDTGIDTNTPDLEGRVLFDVPASGTDTNGHGTHVAGIIAGDGQESLSVTAAPGSPMPPSPLQFRGMAPSAMLFSMGANLSNGPASDAYLQQTAALTNAFISNNSWLYENEMTYDFAAASYDAAVRDALPEVTGPQPLLLIFSAGNSGAGADDGTGGTAGTIASPATAKNVITVGAIEELRSITNQVVECSGGGPVVCQTNQPWLGMTDSSNEIASFSSRGNVGIGVEGAAGRFKPDLVAPGTFIVSTRSTEWDQAAYYGTNNGPGSYFGTLSNLNNGLGPYYRFESGTSLAAAEVAGVLALMQEFFEQRLGLTNSPALMKALLINGARPLGNLGGLHANATTNAQGWGLVQLTNSLPAALSNLNSASSSPIYFFDQEPTNALATGQSQARYLTVAPNARNAPLRVTLVWTDPPGNPVAGLKLVNDLDLIVTNLDTGEVFFGNDIPNGSNFNSAWDTNGPPNLDSVNNVENVFLSPPLTTNYAVTVLGRQVNVNAVTAGTSDIEQDYALVITSDDGSSADALTISNAPPVSASLDPVTVLTNAFTLDPIDTGAVLLHERIGANSPTANMNTVELTNSPPTFLTIGTTNQWRFYILTNDHSYTNAAFLTFLPEDLSPEAGNSELWTLDSGFRTPDLDLYVSQDPTITNLDSSALAAAFRSVSRGGSETLVLSNANPGAYYVAVKCESQEGAEYGFAGVFSQLPFAETDTNGDQLLRGFPAPAFVPGGSPGQPGEACVFCVAPDPVWVHRVVVTNTLTTPAMSDLTGTLTHAGAALATVAPGPCPFVVLNNHSTNGSVSARPFIYDDSDQNDIPGSQDSDGPGSLLNFAGYPGSGQWALTMLSTNHPGTNNSLWILLEHQTSLTNGVTASLLPGACREDFVRLTPEATNLVLSVSITSGSGPLSFQFCAAGDSSNGCQSALISSGLTNYILTLDDTSHPPPHAGLYQLRVCNLSGGPLTFTALVSPGTDPNNAAAQRFTFTGPAAISDDAISSSSIHLANNQRVASAEIGVVVAHPRVSDLALRLVSPSGTSVLLAQNRGGLDTNGMGYSSISTNTHPVTSSGGPEGQTNIIETGQTFGTLFITYQMYDIPDDLRVYYQGKRIYDSGFVSGGGTVNVNYGPGTSTEVTIVMDEGGSTNPTTAWDYSVTYTELTPWFVTFTENTNLTTVPIKFAPVPFVNPLVSTGAFYLPEESLHKLDGQSAAGNWSLQVSDTRAGATNPTPYVMTWQMSLRLQDILPAPIGLPPDAPMTNTLGGGQVQWFSVPAPVWAGLATNRMLSASAPVNLFFNQTTPPTGTNVGDILLLANATAGASVIRIGGSPPLSPGTTYYLGVQNTNASPVTFAVQVDFSIAEITLNNPVHVALAPFSLPRYFFYNVTSNETGVEFQLSNLSGHAYLVVREGLPVPDLGSYDYGSFNPGTNGQEIIVFTNSAPIPLAPGPWYLGIFNVDVTNVLLTAQVTDYTNPVPPMVSLNRGISYAATNSGPSNNIDYYHYVVEPGAVRAQFEIDGPSGNMTLLARRGLPLPSLSSFDYRSTDPQPGDQLITVFDSSSPVPLAPGDWFLAAVDNSAGPVGYSILANDWSGYGTNLTLLDPVEATNEFCFNWLTLPGVRYFVQAKTNLSDATWSTLGPVTATDISTNFCLPLPSPWHFFRVGQGLAPSTFVGHPSIASINVATNVVQLQWSYPVYSRFQVQWSPALAPASWQNVPTIITPNAGLCTFIDDGSQTGGLAPTRFYRLQLLP
jgi:subtilisin-like proprotein convertase family protein